MYFKNSIRVKDLNVKTWKYGHPVVVKGTGILPKRCHAI